MLAADVGNAYEVEQIRVTGSLLGQFGVGRRQRVGEVGDRLARASVELGVDVVDQDVPAPATL